MDYAKVVVEHLIIRKKFNRYVNWFKMGYIGSKSFSFGFISESL